MKDTEEAIVLSVALCFIFLCSTEVFVSVLPLISTSIYLSVPICQPTRLFFFSTEFLGITGETVEVPISLELILL